MNRIVELIILVLFFLTFFTSAINQISPILNYSDELLVLFVSGVALIGGRIRRKYLHILLLLVVFWSYAFLNSVFSSYYRGLFLTVLDLFLFSKPILLYLSLMTIPASIVIRYRQFIVQAMYLYLLFAVLFYFVNIFTPVFPSTDIRFGINAYSFMSNNSGELSNLVFGAGVLVYGLNQSRWGHICSIWMMTFLLLTTLRFKAIVLTALYLLLIVARWFGLIEYKIADVAGRQKITFNRIKLFYMIPILPIGLALGAKQFSHYFLSEMSPRLFLVKNSLIVASDFFPFGAGAGNFGSAVSKLKYSDLYYDLGFSGYWGLSEMDNRFLSDNFWPMVIAQYGVIGTVIVVAIYIMIVRKLISSWSLDYRRSIAVIMVLINIFLSTLGSAVFVGYIGMFLIMVLVLLIREA